MKTFIPINIKKVTNKKEVIKKHKTKPNTETVYKME